MECDDVSYNNLGFSIEVEDFVAEGVIVFLLALASNNGNLRSLEGLNFIR